MLGKRPILRESSPRRTALWRWAGAWGCAFLIGIVPATWADQEDPPGPESSQAPYPIIEVPPSSDDEDDPDAPSERRDGIHPETGEIDECYDAPDAEKWPEYTRAWLFTFSCRTVRGADSWFGQEEDFREDHFGGLLILGAEWDEYDGFDPKLRFRLRTDLPNVSSRVNAFIGRVDEEAEITDQRRQGSRPLSEEYGNDDPSWLLGLGYRRPRERNRGWDWDVGVRLRVPPRPYVRTRYRIMHRFDDDTSLQARQTFFWRQDRGFGTTSHLDLGQQVSPRDHVRWESVATWSEETIGVEWFSGVTWYRQIDGPSGVALLSFARGETDAPIDVYEYGFELTWRRPMGRPWMFISFGPTLTWPRERIEEKREMSFGFAVFTEIAFGEWRR